MKYTIKRSFLLWVIVSFIASLVPTAVIVTVIRATGVEIYGMRAFMVMAAFFIAFFIVLAVLYKERYIQLEHGKIIVGQNRRIRKPPLEIPVTDIDFTELIGEGLWCVYPLPHAEEKYITDRIPVRQPIEGYYISAYDLSAEIVREYCRENSIAINEQELKWTNIQKVELRRRSIRIEYSLKRKFLWKEDVVAKYRDIQLVELVAHNRTPCDDHYIIHLSNGKSYEFGYSDASYDEMSMYTQKHGISLSVTQK